MSKTIQKSKAPWVLSEIIPLVIVFGIALTFVVGYITENVDLTTLIILSIAGFGLGFFLLYENLKRKKRSTLEAELDKEDDYFLSVWMVKPKKEKWKGRLDKDKNSVKLLDMRRAGIISVEGTAVLVLNGEKASNQIFIPTRIIQNNNTVREYIVNAFQAIRDNGHNLDTPKEEDATALKALLLGENVVSAVKAVAQANEKIENPEFELKGRVEKREIPAYRKQDDTVSDVGVLEENESNPSDYVVDKKPVVATRAIGYDKYMKKDTSDHITDALNKLDEVEVEEVVSSGDDGKTLLIPGSNVSISLPANDEVKKDK